MPFKLETCIVRLSNRLVLIGYKYDSFLRITGFLKTAKKRELVNITNSESSQKSVQLFDNNKQCNKNVN